MDRVGEIGYNNFGTKMIIIKYVKSKEIYVEFQDEHKFIKRASYDNFKIGNVKNPYDKKFFGVGYFGEGKYKSRINKEYTKEYGTESNFMCRNDRKIVFYDATHYMRIVAQFLCLLILTPSTFNECFHIKRSCKFAFII